MTSLGVLEAKQTEVLGWGPETWSFRCFSLNDGYSKEVSVTLTQNEQYACPSSNRFEAAQSSISLTFDYSETGEAFEVKSAITDLMTLNHDPTDADLDNFCGVDSCTIYESDGSTVYSGDKLVQSSSGQLNAKTDIFAGWTQNFKVQCVTKYSKHPVSVDISLTQSAFTCASRVDYSSTEVLKTIFQSECVAGVKFVNSYTEIYTNNDPVNCPFATCLMYYNSGSSNGMLS